VKFLGESVFTADQLIKKLKVKPGENYDFFRVQSGFDELRNAYAGETLLEARVRLERDVKDQVVDLTIRIDAGPRVEFAFEGWPVPAAVRKRVSAIWQAGVFDAQRFDEAQAEIRSALIEEGYLESVIVHTTSESAEVKRIDFDIQPGVRYRKVELVFPGTKALKPSVLSAFITKQKLRMAVYTAPDQVVDRRVLPGTRFPRGHRRFSGNATGSR
jgi:outer membrane protein assembly factor BamA